MPVNSAPCLPTLREKIRRNFYAVIFVYALLGVFMMGSVFLASGITPKLIHLNYDSIHHAAKIHQALNALRHSKDLSEKWPSQIETAISAQEKSVTEDGELEVVKEIRATWDSAKTHLSTLDPSVFIRLEESLDRLVEINERGMFRLAETSTHLGQKVFLASSVFFIFSLILVTLLSERLATRLAFPIKCIAEALRGNLDLNRKLKLPSPTSLETKILIHELGDLWDRLYQYQRLNIDEIFSQKEYLYSLISSVDDGILVLDQNQVVVYASPGMLNLLEAAENAVLGHSWFDLSVESSNYLKLRNFFKSTLPHNNSIELNWENQVYSFAARSRPVLNSKKEMIGTLYLVHNISNSRQKERAKGEMITALAHELQVPLQSLKVAAEKLTAEKGTLNPNIRDLADTIFEDSSRIHALSNDFTQVELADLRSLKLHLRKEKLSELVPKWISPFVVLAKDKGIRIEFQKEGSEVIWANVDSSKLPWAFSNLLENAIRVSEPGSEVMIFMTDRSQYAEIEIHDQGKNPAESESQQSGFGLTIAKEVVKAHQGQIEYFSRKPYGSISRISLPYIVVFDS